MLELNSPLNLTGKNLSFQVTELAGSDAGLSLTGACFNHF